MFDSTRILNELAVSLHRRNMVFFCQGCRAYLGMLYKDLDDKRNVWSPWWCKCENHDLWVSLTLQDLFESRREILYANCSQWRVEHPRRRADLPKSPGSPGRRLKGRVPGPGPECRRVHGGDE